MQITKLQKTQTILDLDPSSLSQQLRQGEGGHLPQRRGIVGLAFVALGCMGLIALYQMGLIKHLPDPPLPGFDADKVDASEEAYARFGVPDAFVGLNSFSTTALLAAIGGEDRAQRHPWLPLALGGKLVFDVFQASKLTWDQFSKHKALCVWCLITTLSIYAMVPLALGEVRAAWRALWQR